MNEFDSELKQTLIRLIDEHRWNWGLVRGFVNRKFRSNYDVHTLKDIYRQAKEVQGG